MSKAEDRDEHDRIVELLKNHTKTGRHLFILGVLLLVMLGALTIPVSIALVTGLHSFIEKSEGGPILAGALAGIGVAAAGVFLGAAKMLATIPAILDARNNDPRLRKYLAEVEEEAKQDA